MGFRFRKSIKIAPGVRLNVTKKGISSVSVGKRGATVNVGKKGTRGTVGLPGSGLSYSAYQAHNKAKSAKSKPKLHSETHADTTQTPPIISPIITDTYPTQRQVSIWLGIGILIVPIIFAWFTLRQGYSTRSRVISMAWLLIVLFAIR